MKSFIRIPRIPILFLVVFCFFCARIQGQVPDKINYGKESFAVVKMMEKFHYAPPPLNAQLSERIYKEFIRSLDPGAIYFTQTDLAELQPWQYRLDAEISNCSTTFLDKAAVLYRHCVLRTDSMVSLLLGKAPDFTARDTFYYSQDLEEVFVSNTAALKKKWISYIKYSELYAMYGEEKESNGKSDVHKEVTEEPARREKIKKRLHLRTRRILEAPKGFENKVAADYLNAIALAYDPHSAFFSPAGEADFLAMISTEVSSFGFSLKKNDDGECVVARLKPGGSAWKSNQLHAGDVILKIKVKDRPAVEPGTLSEGELSDLFISITKEETEFGIRTENGQTKTVTLVKTKMKSEENAVTGYLLNTSKPVGYIALPSYYTETGSANPLGCANDVAREIIKLQEEHMEGLILDLRSNGGGALYEAIALAGLFIDEGPLCIFKMKTGKPILIKDMNRGTAYNGPLVVLINGESASATELFAGMMKDYNRALLVGSSTFGKASGQIILPMDSVLNDAGLFPPNARADKKESAQFGSVKVTMEKFYNLHNGTHQRDGVQPDITLPEPFSFRYYKESSMDYALPKDSIVKKIVYNPLQPLPVSFLAGESKARMGKNNGFARMKAIDDSLQVSLKKKGYILLQPEAFRKEELKTIRLALELNKLSTDSASAFKVWNNKYQNRILAMDEENRVINGEVLKTIREDLLIEESCYILLDLMKGDKK
ncbi:MAG: carboxy terminal-processing peptidase [Bacteroidia bacterium]